MSPYGGNYLNQLLSEKLKSKEIQVTAPCFIKKQTVEGVVANIQKIQSVTSMLDNGHTPEEMLGQVLEGLDLEITDTLPAGFHCNCSKERIEKAIISIGKKEIQSMIDDGKEIEVKCHFCNTAYTYSVEELKDLLKKAKR